MGINLKPRLQITTETSSRKISMEVWNDFLSFIGEHHCDCISCINKGMHPQEVPHRTIGGFIPPTVGISAFEGDGRLCYFEVKEYRYSSPILMWDTVSNSYVFARKQAR